MPFKNQSTKKQRVTPKEKEEEHGASGIAKRGNTQPRKEEKGRGNNRRNNF